MLIREEFYAAEGSGKYISDFLADRLYTPRLAKGQVFLLASLIFRETGRAVSGVGPGAEMVLIYNGNRAIGFYGAGAVEDIQAGVPSLAASVYAHWRDNAKLPTWWTED